MLLRLLFTLILLYVIVGLFLMPKVHMFFAVISHHFAWMRP